MSTLLFAITTLSLTTSAPTTLFPVSNNDSIIHVTGATGFQLCTKLNLAGCGTNTLNDLIRTYINNEIENLGYNYTLPFDPCDFDTINMSWILSLPPFQGDVSLISFITTEQVLNEMPCEIYIQMPDHFLSDRGLSNIATDSYWFGPNGKCVYNASNVLDCSNPNRTIVNYTVSKLDCFYPFTHSNYKTRYNQLYEAGFENCGISCDYIPYKGDIKKLDNFNYAACTIALLFGICFFVNIAFEVRKAYIGKTKLSELPLTFDIPIAISIWMLVLTMILGLSSWEGKQYFACENGTNALVADVKRDNKHCYIAGQFTMISICSIYFYCSLLAFAIWRSLANPFKPLFGLNKIWYHIVLNIVVLGYYIGAVAEDIIAPNNVSGICGPNVTGHNGIKYLLTPLLFDISTFTIFTILTIHKLWIHFQNQQKHSAAEKAIANLAIRMVIYSAFIATSLLCFLYLSARFVSDGDEWGDNITANVNCLAENELFGTNNECELNLAIEDDVYWMQGTVTILVSVASFVLSCSNQRYTDYSKMKSSTIQKIKSIGSIGHLGDEASKFSIRRKASQKMSSKDNGESGMVSVVSDTRIVIAENNGTTQTNNGKDKHEIEMTEVEKTTDLQLSHVSSNEDDNVGFEKSNNENNMQTYS